MSSARTRWAGQAPAVGAIATVVVLALASSAALAAERGSGHFRLGEQRLEVVHVLAVARDQGHGDAGAQTLVYLSDVPLDAGQAAAAFDPDEAIRTQMDDRQGAYVRLCIDADGSECGLYFSGDGFNTGGYGTLALTSHDDGHIAGRWVLKEPQSFFGKTYDFDLQFDAEITPPPGKDLPVDGGEPGMAYRAYVTALANGDVAALRQLTDRERGFHFPQDDDAQVKQSLKSARDGEPVAVKILRGRIDGDRAVLWVEGEDRDGIGRSGRVQLRKAADGWRFVESDLESVD